ncbi:hypothetical protein B0H10DRAFT_2209293 [Mycena sp. CBHHK59/15]|nr:hypothetical protein B0H10DRAFT_2209293 [Mycena sp. CBHHK59/15]
MADLAEDYDSDTETALQPIDYNASRDEAFKALKSAQLYAMKLLEENRKLHQENATLRAAAPKKRQANEDVQSCLSKDKPDAPENVWDQFTSDTLYATSMAIALFEEVPTKFHPLLNMKTYSSFANDFIGEHSDGRSTFLNTLRKALPIILKGLAIDSDILIRAKADRSKDPIIAGLLKFPHESKPGRFPPVLFSGGTQNMSKAFTGPYFMKTLCVMFYGTGSLVHNAKPASHSNGIKLGFKKITEVSMSAAATALRLVLSRDTEWNAKGAVTGTNYEADYRAYMELLTFNRDQPHIKKILKKVHDFVFAGVDLSIDSNADTDANEEGEDDLNELMRRFELGTDAVADGLALPLDPAPPSPITS